MMCLYQIPQLRGVQYNYDKFTMRPLVTMGYCLGLSEAEMEDVLLPQGLSFNPHDKAHQAYKFLFSGFPAHRRMQRISGKPRR